MRVFMTVIALVEWIALGIQFWLTVNLSIANGIPVLRGMTNYFSYFTILSNLGGRARSELYALGAGN
ncbi:MAG TPA: hypothetical protein VNW47_16780 [Terriglobales bacterium]|jgi:hypothetical protein|nr:hypothetical protein [Terriglobales bacterium]